MAESKVQETKQVDRQREECRRSEENESKTESNTMHLYEQ